MPDKKKIAKKASAVAIPTPEPAPARAAQAIQRTITVEIGVDGATKIAHERRERDY